MIIPQIDINHIIDKLSLDNFSSAKEQDQYYLDSAYFIFDTYDALLEIENQEITGAEAKEILIFLDKFQPQISKLAEVMYFHELDSMNYERLYIFVTTLEDELPLIKARLQAK